MPLTVSLSPRGEDRVRGLQAFCSLQKSEVPLKTYIVRIYRLDKKNPRHLVGVVEEVGVKEKKAFTNYDELWDILISSRIIIQKQKQKRKEVREKE